jgi:hypothetical protein
MTAPDPEQSTFGCQSIGEAYEMARLHNTQTCEGLYHCRELGTLWDVTFVKAEPAVTAGFGVYGAHGQMGMVAEGVLPFVVRSAEAVQLQKSITEDESSRSRRDLFTEQPCTLNSPADLESRSVAP